MLIQVQQRRRLIGCKRIYIYEGICENGALYWVCSSKCIPYFVTEAQFVQSTCCGMFGPSGCK